MRKGSTLAATSTVADPSAQQLESERTRLLYLGSRLPTLLMMLTGLAYSLLLWTPGNYLFVSVWLVWVVMLGLLRMVHVAHFHQALPSEQAQPRWRYSFLLGAMVSGITLALAAVVLVPPDAMMLQAVVAGLIALAILTASISYAVSLPAFLAFALPCLLPVSVSLLLDGSERGVALGTLVLILLLALVLVAWQVNRLVWVSLQRRFENQHLLENLTHAKRLSDQLNTELAREVEQRRKAERGLRQMYQDQEQRVLERTQELAQTGHALSQSEARLALALQASGLGLWDWNLQTDEVHHTQIQEIFGLSPDLVRCMLRDLRPRVHADDLLQLQRNMIEHFKGLSDSYCVQYRVRHENGSWVWIEDRGQAVERDAQGRVLRMVGTRRNIGALKTRDEEQRLAATVFEATSEGILILDMDYGILAANEAVTQISGYRPEELIGRRVMDLVGSSETRTQYKRIRYELEQADQWQGELLDTRKNGELYPQYLQLKLVRDSQGQAKHMVCFLADLSVRRAAEERLRYLSHYDALTGLANRALFKERLHEASQRVRQQGKGMALLHIDLDRFKILNDSLGHEVADQMLRQMAKRLSQTMGDADTIARLSGDEFAVILDTHGSVAHLARMASRLLSKLRMPMDVAGHELVVSASIGISLMPDNARETSNLLSQANMAMQHAKHLGGNTFQFYTENLQACTLERLQLENQLRKAIEEQQLEVYYQPKLSLATNRLESAEALVRWHHPQQGLVPPGDFIGLAEETGLIGAIGDFVLRQSCWQACQWHAQGLTGIRVSVNVSVHQLRQGNFIRRVREVLEETGLAPHYLELELTESQLLDNVENIISIFQQLRELGVWLAIDDFGTGFSSLSYLKRFPVDVVKIDQTFIRDLSEQGEDAAITRAIIALAHSLELQVVAEGVETQQQLDFLKEQHCDEVQGYLISRPVPAAELERFVRASELAACAAPVEFAHE